MDISDSIRSVPREEIDLVMNNPKLILGERCTICYAAYNKTEADFPQGTFLIQSDAYVWSFRIINENMRKTGSYTHTKTQQFDIPLGGGLGWATTRVYLAKNKENTILSPYYF